MGDMDWLMRASKSDPAPTGSDYLFKFIGMAVMGIVICVIVGGGLAAIMEVTSSTIDGLDPVYSPQLEGFLTILPLLFVILGVSWFVYKIGMFNIRDRW